MLEVREIFKTYAGNQLLKDITFTIGEGETICLLGASGSGKSTLLRIIAGLESPDSGFISFNGIDLRQTPPHLRDFGLVFQDYALFPHLNVNENVSFGLKMRRLEQSEINERVVTALNLVSLSRFGERKITDLSGGEQQRVALARALAIRPRLLMFDEPLGALDRSLREGLLSELRSILRQTKIPAIYVTHDQEEAFTIADRVLILHAGNIVREGTPAEMWSNPGSAFVASFLGLGNVIDGEVLAENKFQTRHGIFTLRCSHKHATGDKVKLLMRPQTADPDSEMNTFSGVVTDVIFQQERFRVTFEEGVYVYLPAAPGIGQKISVKVKVECLA